MDSERELLEQWTAMETMNEMAQARDRKPLNVIEITRIPKKINAKSMTSMIVTASQIVPRKVEICYRGQIDDREPFGLVEYKTANDAFLAAEKIRQSTFCKGWRLKLREEVDSEVGNPLRNPKSLQTLAEQTELWRV